MNFAEAADRLAYYGSDFDLGRTIVETIVRLLDPVAQFALERCRFTSVGKSVYGMCLPGRIAASFGRRWEDATTVLPDDKWILVLTDPLPADDAHSIVAHEIAHAWRGDDVLSMIGWECERAITELVAKWGFVGLGTDVEHAMQVHTGETPGPTPE